MVKIGDRVNGEQVYIGKSEFADETVHPLVMRDGSIAYVIVEHFAKPDSYKQGAECDIHGNCEAGRIFETTLEGLVQRINAHS